jgi:hypothetical protein
MPRRRTVTRLEQLVKINVDAAVKKDGWSRIIDGQRIELEPELFNGKEVITLIINGVKQSACWFLSSVPIHGRLRRGGYVPWDRNLTYYVASAGEGSRRHRYLYVNPISKMIGTRTMLHNVQYSYNCMSARQRVMYKARLSIHRRYRHHSRIKVYREVKPPAGD